MKAFIKLRVIKTQKRKLPVTAGQIQWSKKAICMCELMVQEVTKKPKKQISFFFSFCCDTVVACNWPPCSRLSLFLFHFSYLQF